MSKVKIISDSTCDLSEELLAQFDVAFFRLPLSGWRAIAGQCDHYPGDIYRL